MDGIEALLLLEERLSPNFPRPVSPAEFATLADAVVAAASIPEGYSGEAWKYGVTLLQTADAARIDLEDFFESFGWLALAAGLRSAIANNDLLNALSFVDKEFTLLIDHAAVFEHPIVSSALVDSLNANPRISIKAAELATVSETVQQQFGFLLTHLSKAHVAPDTVLQCSASALRVLPVEHRVHRSASAALIKALLDNQRAPVAYYCFRALAEQHEDLWGDPTSAHLIQTLTELALNDNSGLTETLLQLCADEDVLRKCSKQPSLLALLGILSIYFCSHHDCQNASNAAWQYINDLHVTHSLVAHAISEYFMMGTVPKLPQRRAHQIQRRREELDHAIEIAEQTLRDRQYDGVPLAIEIYQQNVQQVFLPVLEEIRSQGPATRAVALLQAIDAEDLIAESESQKAALYPIEGKLFRKMISDNNKILRSLKDAAQLSAKLSDLLASNATIAIKGMALYKEFQSLMLQYSQAVNWAFCNLLPDLWRVFSEGSVIVREEEEMIYAARIR